MGQMTVTWGSGFCCRSHRPGLTGCARGERRRVGGEQGGRGPFCGVFAAKGVHEVVLALEDVS